MKHIQIRKFSLFTISFLAFSVIVFAQKQSKNYKETFNVNRDVVIDINTSYADIEFETWNKNVVEVEGTLEVEGLTKEDAEDYFKSWAFEVVGNSSKVTISTKPSHWKHKVNDLTFVSGSEVDFHLVPNVEIEHIIADVHEIHEIAPVPPVPPLPVNFNNFSFDYEAYRRDGDKYLEEWKKEFKENFNESEDFKNNIEKWKMEVEHHREALEQHKEELEQRREEMIKRREEMIERRQEMNEKRSEARQKQHEAREEHRMIIQEALNEARNDRREAVIKIKESGSKPNVFYFSSDDGHDKNLKVKKTIKVKLPKNASLKMNVRHGEVKLAENFENINATLSHTRLLASVIDGENSIIEASYSPVLVDNWNYGELKVNYVKNVELKNVKSLKLVSESSSVILGNISEDAIINGNFGDLKIENVQNDFKRLEIVLNNTNAIIVLPNTAFDFYSSSSDSKVDFPKRLQLDITKKYSNQLAKGFNENKSSNKNVSIVAAFSDVEIK